MLFGLLQCDYHVAFAGFGGVSAVDRCRLGPFVLVPQDLSDVKAQSKEADSTLQMDWA